MEDVASDFFKHLPVGDVVSALDRAARSNICSLTGIDPEKLPKPLFAEAEVEKAVQLLREAVTANVSDMQKSFQNKLEEERAEHTEELNRQRRVLVARSAVIFYNFALSNNLIPLMKFTL